MKAKSFRCRRCEQARRQRCRRLGALRERSERRALAASASLWEEEAPVAVRVPPSSRARRAMEEDRFHPLLAGAAAHSRPKTPCRPLHLSHPGGSMRIRKRVTKTRRVDR